MVIFILLALLLWPPVPASAAETFRDCRNCPEMVEVPKPDGKLAFSVTEITFDDWQVCVAAKGCPGGQDDHHWGRGTRPVINITFAQAMGYAAWLAKSTGKPYRLPTEAEWEFAARGGVSSDYWWGNEIGSNRANCRECGSQWSGISSAPVGSFPANPYGLYDMNGNVWGWTTDCWTGTGPACEQKVIRGGSWYYYAPMAKATSRARMSAKEWSYNVGIRVVRPTE